MLADETRQARPYAGTSAPAELELGSNSFLNPSSIFNHLKRAWPLILACALLGLLAGAVLAFLPRHYTAVSRIQVRPGSSSQYRLDSSELLNAAGGDTTKLETETMVLESDTLLLDTAHKLHLDTDPDFMGPLSTKPVEPALAEERLLAVLHRNIHVVLVPRSEIIQISCNTRNSALSARVVNTLVAEYIQRLFESRFSSTQRVAKWLSSQLDDLKEQVERDEEKLVQLQSRLGIVGLDQNHDIVVTELEDLTKAADEARAERIVAEARYRILSNGDLNLIEGGQDLSGRSAQANSQAALLANLRNQKAQLEARYAGLSAQFGTKYPEVQQAAAELATLNREIDKEQGRVLNQAQEAYDAAKNNEQTIFGTLNDKKSQAFQKQNEMVQYQILLHDYESDRTLYEGLLQRLRQAGIVSGLESSEVDIVDLARIPGRPSEMSRSATLALSVFFGLVTGLVLALLVAQFDQRLRDLSAVETQLGLPLLSITTRIARNDLTKESMAALQNNLPSVFSDPSTSRFVESMWSLRAALLLSNPSRPPKTILISSCNPGEGKSTIASAQACTLALRDARVLLIDADMRRPTIHRRFGLKNSRGLSSVLSSQIPLEQVIQGIADIPNLSVMTSGPVPPSAALLLSSERLSALFATLGERYDFIVIDSPPILGISDGSTLAQFAEAIVIVLSYENFHPSQIQRAVKVLHRVGRSITGVTLNFADPASLGAYGYGDDYYYTASANAGKTATR